MEKPNPKYIQELIQIVNSSLFPSHMSMRLASIDIDTAEIEMDITPQHFQAMALFTEEF